MAAAIGILLLVASRPVAIPTIAEGVADERPAQWFRGNIHTHTLWSDGDDYPEMVALWYKDHGYQFLCFTDHNTLLRKERWIDRNKNKGGAAAFDKLQARFPEGWINERTSPAGVAEIRLKTFDEIRQRFGAPGEFLLIQGEEISDRLGNLPVHLNATNVRDAIPPLGGDTVYDILQRNTDALVAQRERTGQPMMIHLNHPNFHYGVTAEDLMRVRGENFFEVYNGHPGVNNAGDAEHASTERIWDIILTQRIANLGLPLMYGLATDDGHEYHKIPSRSSEPGRGWIMVQATELTAAALIDALDSGRFYASSGVRLDAIHSTEKAMNVAVDEQPGVRYTIDFIGTRKGFDPRSEPVTDSSGKPVNATRRYSADVGRILHTVNGARGSYAFHADDLYVRARVTASKKHPNPSVPGEFERAWGQPVRGPGAPAE
jgi:hypothetical protein